MGIHLLCCAHGEERTTSHDVVQNVYATIAKICEISCFAKIDPCLPTPYLKIFVSTNQDCVINWWCLQVGKRYHHQPHLNWFGVVRCSFSWGCGNNHDSNKGWFLSWSIPDGHFSPSSYRGFRISTPTRGWVFHRCANMAWGAKGTRNFHLLVLHSFYKQGVVVALQWTQVISILKRAITIGEGSSRLNILSRVLPFHYLICLSQ